jgi:amino acid transporter
LPSNYPGALCYAELGTIIKESGGDYIYLHFAYGSLVSYSNSWVNNLLVRPASQTIITLTCAQYLITLFFDDGCGIAPEIIAKLLAVFILC